MTVLIVIRNKSIVENTDMTLNINIVIILIQIRM